MVVPLAVIVEAERAENGAVGAVEVGAEVCCSFLAVGETGDYSGSEGIVVNHGCWLL